MSGTFVEHYLDEIFGQESLETSKSVTLIIVFSKKCDCVYLNTDVYTQKCF